MPDELKKSELQLPDYKSLIQQNKDSGWPDVTPQEKMFAFKYLETFKHRDAGEESEFSPNSGLKLLRKPLINAFIAQIQGEYQQRSIVDADFVRTQWLQLLPKVMGEEEVPIVLADGTQIEARKFHAADSTRVLSELSKSTKFYEGGSGGSGNVSINIDLGALGITADISQEKVINHEDNDE